MWLVVLRPTSLQRPPRRVDPAKMDAPQHVHGRVPKWQSPPPTTADLPCVNILTIDLAKNEAARGKLVDVVSTALERDGFFDVNYRRENRTYTFANCGARNVP